MRNLISSIAKVFQGLKRRINGNKPEIYSQIPIQWKSILRHRVQFYNRLNTDKKKDFEDRIQYFLQSVKFTGINTKVTDIDRVLVAAGAVITLFGLENGIFPIFKKY